MKKKSISKIFMAVLCTTSVHAISKPPKILHGNAAVKKLTERTLPPFVYDLDPGFTIQQNVNQKGLLIISGKLKKPFTPDDVKLVIKYKDELGNWTTGWSKLLYSYNQYNENLTAMLEIPASSLASYNVKIELSSNSNINNFNSITWEKSISHYKASDYANSFCDLDENEYTMLLTPRKNGTVITDANGKVTGVKDRITSDHYWNKLGNIIMDNKKNDVIFSPTIPAILNDINGIKSVKMDNQGGTNTVLGSTPQFIYNSQSGHPTPYLYTYDDPVYIFAGKFSTDGFLLDFSQWEGDADGVGYHNFKVPNQLKSRYFNLTNTITEKLSEIINDQEPVVIVSSAATGFRIYKSDGTYKTLTGFSNYGSMLFGYGDDQGGARRGSGSEHLIISNTPEMTLYGVGTLRNSVKPHNYQTIRTLSDIEREIYKFIRYTGIFQNSTAYDDNTEYKTNCYTINSGATSDYTVVDWTLAPNSYIFTGKDKNGNAVEGLNIPVKKAYEMWARGGEFMRDEQGNYTPIPSGTENAGLYWEDEVGLIKSVSLEGTGENAKIKVLVNKLKEGNAVVSYKVNDKVYWTWHVWVTDDPRNGSTYNQGFELDKNGNPISDWRWMDRNLGATTANLTGHDFRRAGGLQYQWGRKDPFPSNYKDFSTYMIRGEVGTLNGSVPTKYRGNLYAPSDNTGFDSPNGNIRYSINNPINYIIPPVYVYKIGETPNSNGENYVIQGPSVTDWDRKELTTWFSKSKYKNFNPSNHYDNVTWDLWADTRGGKWSNMNTSLTIEANESRRYAMKSPYDPCPCEWRVPSSYSSVDVEPRTNPWGKSGSLNSTDIKPDVQNTTFPGIIVYPGYGFDLSNITDGRKLGMLPINGNYEYYPQSISLKDGSNINRDANKLFKNPTIGFQDQHSDGGLHTTTFFSSIGNPGEQPLTGTRGLVLISDAGNVPKHSSVGFHHISTNKIIEGNTYESRGVRCIKDPNNAYMPTAFETEYINTPASQYTLEQLKSWTKEPNSYVEYTNPTLNVSAANKDRVIDIPLRKAYAMNKLYLSQNNEMPSGSAKSFSVVWTTDPQLISSMEIIGGDGSIENAKLRVILNEGRTGNAVVAFHLGNSIGNPWSNGNNSDPVMWSWHIWAPKSVIQEQPEFSTETVANGGVKQANSQFVSPVNSYYGVPLKTILMDRDLGALGPFLNQHMVEQGLYGPFYYNAGNANYYGNAIIQNIKDSGGLHYQWGRKDPIPVFYYPGGYFEHSAGSSGTTRDLFRKYTIFRQIGINNSTPVYSTGINEDNYIANYTKEYSAYSNTITTNDTTENKIKKVLKYSVNNPSTFLYQNTPSNSDWISNENGLSQDRWGHANEKSPYDPCPEGWRIPDLQGVGTNGVDIFDGFLSYGKGNTPWFYNAKFEETVNVNGVTKIMPRYGLDPLKDNTFVSNEAYDIKKMNYLGGYVRAKDGTAPGTTKRAQTRYGFILNRPEYNIGNFANNGIRGFDGGNSLNMVNSLITYSGIWTAASMGSKALGMFFKTEISAVENPDPYNLKLYYFTPSFTFKPQAAMSCRCAKIEYDANGNEIGRYEPFAIAVPKNTTGKAANVFAQKQIEEIKKDEKKLSVFPNPVKSLLYINADDKDYFYQIYNSSGQLVKEGKFENKKADLSTLPQGMYLVRINNAETVVKIIKE
ncbi:T9SS type A sorting domain-containing protein [Chryseobacterium sp. PS-8]|uniref:T9SS type A sorting domain-containing protein n=1 Tax=Chryseobacterium indicum TaxID=2766954 RepID=A0ABS9CA19_9FLAO|nr:T9SS type A sorting domain-containing protein [Chryseobacterium sp. PS-8]MCF2221276.1 T9SS type A sorting domain-containing protein [Chryseobacterium sp. PS-8]